MMPRRVSCREDRRLGSFRRTSSGSSRRPCRRTASDSKRPPVNSPASTTRSRQKQSVGWARSSTPATILKRLTACSISKSRPQPSSRRTTSWLCTPTCIRQSRPGSERDSSQPSNSQNKLLPRNSSGSRLIWLNDSLDFMTVSLLTAVENGDAGPGQVSDWMADAQEDAGA